MRKQWIAFALLAAVTAVPSVAKAAGYGAAGCGLGSIVFGDKEGIVQIFAATTNAIYYNQMFGITSGTSNCAAAAEHKKKAELFITANRDALEKDISRGSGENLSSFAHVMGCSDAGMLGQALQQNFIRIFPDRTTSTEQVSDTIWNTIQTNSELAQSCGVIS